ncbi:MAG: HDIG domain-containing protein [Candidatus Eisenbacteria bacterium]|uniref:HDIG domain-containing protein n=1 Tax=Eiseniibacteriota bacterium TaxID=2212470 RepID=A0A937XBA5_UNCEI|nr:HDIG domain-containing protein [Candidatus Eisenbacteria bacterium]
MITKQEIEKLFAAQLAKIKDARLREQTVEVWVEGCRRGGWQSVEQLTAMPFTLLTPARGVNFIEHTIAVTEGALALARAQADAYRALPYAIDEDRLIAGGLLHDVGKLLEIEPDGSGGYRKTRSGRCARHPISGAILVGAAGLPDELVNVVACHAKEGDGRPQVIETVLIHQADFATFDPLVMLEKGTLIQ